MDWEGILLWFFFEHGMTEREVLALSWGEFFRIVRRGCEMQAEQRKRTDDDEAPGLSQEEIERYTREYRLRKGWSDSGR